MDDPATYDGGVLLVLEEQLRRELDRIEERRRDLDASRELLSKVTSIALGATEPPERAHLRRHRALGRQPPAHRDHRHAAQLRAHHLRGPGPRREHDARQRGPDPARRAAARGLPGERAVVTAGPALDERVGRGGRGPADPAQHRHRVRGLRRDGGRGPGRLGRPGPGLRRDPRPAHREALHRLLRPRLEARGARAPSSADARAAATPSSSSCSSSA